MKTDQKLKSIIEFAFEALKITISYIEHNRTNPTKKKFHKFNELLLNELVRKCYNSKYLYISNISNVINSKQKNDKSNINL